METGGHGQKSKARLVVRSERANRILGLLTRSTAAPTIRCVSYNLAELFERIADAVPEREAVSHPVKQ